MHDTHTRAPRPRPPPPAASSPPASCPPSPVARAGPPPAGPERHASKARACTRARAYEQAASVRRGDEQRLPVAARAPRVPCEGPSSHIMGGPLVHARARAPAHTATGMRLRALGRRAHARVHRARLRGCWPPHIMSGWLHGAGMGRVGGGRGTPAPARGGQRCLAAPACRRRQATPHRTHDVAERTLVANGFCLAHSKALSRRTSGQKAGGAQPTHAQEFRNSENRTPFHKVSIGAPSRRKTNSMYEFLNF